MEPSRIFIDCDAMPRPLKEALLKIAEREQITIFFVAATPPRLPVTAFVRVIGAGGAFNGADDWIVDAIRPGDLAVTADIPLADRILAKGAEALSIKGDFFTAGNIKNFLAMRELMDELRVSGEITGGPAPFSDRQRTLFLNALNRFLQRRRNLISTQGAETQS